MLKQYYIVHFILQGKSNIESFRCSFCGNVFRKQKLMYKIEKAIAETIEATDRNQNQKHLLKSLSIFKM